MSPRRLADDRAEPVLSLIKRELDAAEADPVVKNNIKRHYEHLETLAATLRKLGMDDQEIDSNVASVFEEYRRELTAYLRLSTPRVS
jgi:hypothetical protein